MHVPLDQLRPDMVLSADLKDAGGRLLLPAGTTLTEKHIRYCQMWGIAEVRIVAEEEAEEETAPVIDPARLAAAEAALAPRFGHVDLHHPAIAAVFRYCVQQALRKTT
ncbi:MAG: hypothetical protein AB7S39_18440 [Gemmatimonadales bacterium]